MSGTLFIAPKKHWRRRVGKEVESLFLVGRTLILFGSERVQSCFVAKGRRLLAQSSSGYILTVLA